MLKTIKVNLNNWLSLLRYLHIRHSRFCSVECFRMFITYGSLCSFFEAAAAGKHLYIITEMKALYTWTVFSKSGRVSPFSGAER